ncbi:hypothetical protein DFH08DRAFT_934765 [Mycena albidolilacea]|uniref:Uncharacterized protein n=1 Tax=Mycena albidolilacea TaxID=1033008 RepID=A0AAD7AA05_9AGAR|nr:hypothetical protein DFH08DRAFT_934765 [Mycena albidolilacea]
MLPSFLAPPHPPQGSFDFTASSLPPYIPSCPSSSLADGAAGRGVLYPKPLGSLQAGTNREGLRRRRPRADPLGPLVPSRPGISMSYERSLRAQCHSLRSLGRGSGGVESFTTLRRLAQRCRWTVLTAKPRRWLWEFRKLFPERWAPPCLYRLWVIFDTVPDRRLRRGFPQEGGRTSRQGCLSGSQNDVARDVPSADSSDKLACTAHHSCTQRLPSPSGRHKSTPAVTLAAAKPVLLWGEVENGRSAEKLHERGRAGPHGRRLSSGACLMGLPGGRVMKIAWCPPPWTIYSTLDAGYIEKKPEVDEFLLSLFQRGARWGRPVIEGQEREHKWGPQFDNA